MVNEEDLRRYRYFIATESLQTHCKKSSCVALVVCFKNTFQSYKPFPLSHTTYTDIENYPIKLDFACSDALEWATMRSQSFCYYPYESIHIHTTNTKRVYSQLFEWQTNFNPYDGFVKKIQPYNTYENCRCFSRWEIALGWFFRVFISWNYKVHIRKH